MKKGLNTNRYPPEIEVKYMSENPSPPINPALLESLPFDNRIHTAYQDAYDQGKPYIIWITGSYHQFYYEKDYDSAMQRLGELREWQSRIGDVVELIVEKVEGERDWYYKG